MSFDAELGPINYIVVTFASAPVPNAGLEGIQRLVDQGRIVVLDIEFVAKDVGGEVSRSAQAMWGRRSSKARLRN
ncbi:MAG: hypothetical protein R2709_15810 [Marmoricola sp.]